MQEKFFNFIITLYFGVLFVYLTNTYPKIILKYPENFKII